MRLRTLDGQLVRGKLTTEYPLSTDGFPVLIVKGEPYGPEDADFYLESATTIERKHLAKGGYNLERWSEHGEDQNSVGRAASPPFSDRQDILGMILIYGIANDIAGSKIFRAKGMDPSRGKLPIKRPEAPTEPPGGSPTPRGCWEITPPDSQAPDPDPAGHLP